jgi:hypothetical protein
LKKPELAGALVMFGAPIPGVIGGCWLIQTLASREQMNALAAVFLGFLFGCFLAIATAIIGALFSVFAARSLPN